MSWCKMKSFFFIFESINKIIGSKNSITTEKVWLAGV